MSFVKKFTSDLPDTKHQSWTVENSYMIQFPDISPKIHRFHSFALRIEKQMNLGYNSSSSLRYTDHQSHWFTQKNSRHPLCTRINFSVYFLFMFFTFAVQQPLWLSNCCSWKVGNVPGKEPAWVSKSWAVPWSDSQVGAPTNQFLQTRIWLVSVDWSSDLSPSSYFGFSGKPVFQDEPLKNYLILKINHCLSVGSCACGWHERQETCLWINNQIYPIKSYFHTSNLIRTIYRISLFLIYWFNYFNLFFIQWHQKGETLFIAIVFCLSYMDPTDIHNLHIIGTTTVTTYYIQVYLGTL